MITRLSINGAFYGQTVTGQQRYAVEISNELIKQVQQARILAPGKWWQRRPVRAWLWAQLVPLRSRKSAILISLTSRSPLVAPRHVIVVHDLFIFRNPEWYSKAYIMSHAPILWVQLKLADAIIAVSEPVAKQVTEQTRSKKPVLVAPNAPAAIFRQGVSDELLQSTLDKYGLVSGRYVLAVASRDPRKNLAGLVRGFLALPESLRHEFPLVLVGGTNTVFATVDLPLDRSVMGLGYVEDGELAALYASSRLVAFPSLDEGFGLPAVEAMSAGARILVSDVEVMRWVCQEHAHYVDPKSDTSISAGLFELLSKDDDETEKRKRKEYVNTRFTWERSAATIVGGLSEIVNKRSNADRSKG